MITKSLVTLKTYDTDNTINIYDWNQVSFQVSLNVELFDVFSTNDGKLVFVFNREKSKEPYQQWLNRKKEKRNDKRR